MKYLWITVAISATACLPYVIAVICVGRWWQLYVPPKLKKPKCYHPWNCECRECAAWRAIK